MYVSHKTPRVQKDKKCRNSPQNTFFFSRTSRRYLFLELLSLREASGSFVVVSSSSRRARRRERRFSFGRVVLSRCPQSDEGNLNRRDSRSIVVVVHIRGSLVMSRARVIARGKDAIFLASGMVFPFSTSRALRARFARAPRCARCVRVFSNSLSDFSNSFSPSPPKKHTPTERYSTKNESKNVQSIGEPAHVNRRFHASFGNCRHRSRHRFSIRLRGATVPTGETVFFDEESWRGGDENLHESEKTDAESESGGIRGGAGEENVVREESDAKACTGEEIDGGGEFDEPDESKHEN